jgi:hypothetical protein
MASVNAMEFQINMSDKKISAMTIDQFLSESVIPVTRKVKGKIKTIDIRPYIDHITKKDQVLTVQTKTIGGRTVRIDEIISQLFIDHRNGVDSFPVHKTRQLINTNGSVVTPMDVR